MSRKYKGGRDERLNTRINSKIKAKIMAYCNDHGISVADWIEAQAAQIGNDDAQAITTEEAELHHGITKSYFTLDIGGNE